MYVARYYCKIEEFCKKMEVENIAPQWQQRMCAWDQTVEMCMFYDYDVLEMLLKDLLEDVLYIDTKKWPGLIEFLESGMEYSDINIYS